MFNSNYIQIFLIYCINKLIFVNPLCELNKNLSIVIFNDNMIYSSLPHHLQYILLAPTR